MSEEDEIFDEAATFGTAITQVTVVDGEIKRELVPRHDWHDHAYVEGYASEKEGINFLDNPYPCGTTDARRWVDGKVDAIIHKREGKTHGKDHDSLACGKGEEEEK